MTGPLLQAYMSARYEIELDGGRLRLRIGEPAPALERAWPGACYALLTAFNPGSRRLPDAANRAADAALRTDLAAAGLRCLRSHSSDGKGRWVEPGWLVAGLDAEAADRLARRYGQAAILHWKAGEAVRLRMYLPRSPGIEPPYVDWNPV